MPGPAAAARLRTSSAGRPALLAAAVAGALLLWAASTAAASASEPPPPPLSEMTVAALQEAGRAGRAVCGIPACLLNGGEAAAAEYVYAPSMAPDLAAARDCLRLSNDPTGRPPYVAPPELALAARRLGRGREAGGHPDAHYSSCSSSCSSWLSSSFLLLLVPPSFVVVVVAVVVIVVDVVVDVVVVVLVVVLVVLVVHDDTYVRKQHLRNFKEKPTEIPHWTQDSKDHSLGR